MKPYVMDSSAALAILFGEAGSEVAMACLPDAECSPVNAAEVIAKLIDKGRSADQAADDFFSLGMPVTAVDEDEGVLIGQLRAATKHLGLSLGDRSCLALSIKNSAIAVTADRSWVNLDIGCKIKLIR